MIRSVLAVLVFVMAVSVMVTVVAASTIFGTVAVSATVTIVVSPIPEDLDGDGYIGQEDLSIVTRAIRRDVQPPGVADVNGDGQVDILDVAQVAAGFGNGTCP